MRRTGALLVSMTVHVIVAGGLVLWSQCGGEEDGSSVVGPRSSAGEEVMDVVVVAPPPSDVVEVVMLDPAPAPVSAPAPASAPAPRAISTGTSAGNETGTGTGTGTEKKSTITDTGTGTGTGTGTEKRSAITGDAIGDVLARIAEGGKKAPPPVVKSGKLHETGGNAARIDDRVTTVKVDNDGNVHFHDSKAIQIHILPGIPNLHEIGKELGDGLDAWRKDPYKAVHDAGVTQDLPRHETAIGPGACDEYGSCVVYTEDHLPPSQTIPLIGGRFEITDALMRAFKVGDPYAARKRALLAATFDERVQKGEIHHKEQLDKSSEIMRGNLNDLWRRVADPGERKEALFELWDECSEGDDSSGMAGQRARAEVIGWIRSRLPKGAAGSFSDADVAAFAKKKSSKQDFTPYE